MAKTKIEWTERVWNPVTGCTKVSQGCKHCYAEVIAKRFWKDRKFTDIQCHEDRLEQPFHWRKPSMVFVNSMSDLFHESVPFEFIKEVFHVMDQCPRHTFQILTKRPDRAKLFYNWTNFDIKYYKTNHIWLGTSIEDQPTADKRIIDLLQTPAAMRWVNYEPALGEVDFMNIPVDGKHVLNCLSGEVLTKIFHKKTGYQSPDDKIHWIVCGGESGHGARPMQIEWARKVMNDCKTAGVPFFMKQICDAKGHKIPFEDFPEDLKIREYPIKLFD